MFNMSNMLQIETNNQEKYNRILNLSSTIEGKDNYAWINEFSSFICSYDSSYYYNQTFLPNLFEKFIHYIKAFQEYDEEMDNILKILKTQNNKLKNNKNKKEFLISINNYIQSNLLGDKNIVVNTPTSALFTTKKNSLITLSYKNEICTFKCYKKKDGELKLNKKEITKYYNHLLNFRR
jgi:hypothetical protein